ncbi:serine/threonine-protein kinase [Actinoallomurus sp. NBC_01490]|uniref:protein kinase domain-containing protein n=1 Tax=Actinoallomurus sp. NBC_01490 TaxID=2903557 RepID=UPI002E30C02C|nr:protein kinase [Actinoallomurus sp. NBC_01490]
MGPYTLLARLGEGGMGAVYLGRGPDGRQVAVKVVRPELAQDAGFAARFQDEVNNARRVASFCTAQVLDHGESGGRAYMVTEYIDGVSLKEYVRQNGELSPGMLHGVAVGVAAALVAIHAAGLIHRDLKPANVMLSYSGPRVIDFGIARALDAAAGLTMTGRLVGSPGWMAPERILRQQVTTAADIFSWGCVVAFARTGVNPFGTGDFSVMSARLVHGEPMIGDLPAPLDRLVRAALDKDPHNRPTARDLLLALVGGETGEAGEAAVLGTLTAWQDPVPPAGPDPVSGQGSVPPAGPGTPDGPGHTVAAGSGLPGGPGRTVETTPDRTAPAGPAAPGATAPGGSPAGGRGRVLLAAVAAVVVAAAVTGWLVTRDDGGKPSGATAGAGPAPLPSDALLVRIDRQSGWPSRCHGSIGRLVPTTRVATKVISDDDKCDILPRWSPDRKQIAFTRNVSATVNELWITNADGSGTPRMITNIIDGRTRTAWSPDGRKVAIVAKTPSGRQIAVITLARPQTPLLLTGDGDDKDDPAWCGSRIAFWSTKSGTQQIYTIDAATAGGRWTQVTHDDHDVNDPSFSPDCKTMAYTEQPTKDARHVWLTPSDGTGTPRRLTSEATRDMDATFSPDGAWIATARGETAHQSIWAIRVDGTGAVPVSSGDLGIAHPDWS